MPDRVLKRLHPESPRKPFDCGDNDLNDFFQNDSREHARQLLTVTYALESERETIAYFSVLNDNIRESDTSKKEFKKISKKNTTSKKI